MQLKKIKQNKMEDTACDMPSKLSDYHLPNLYLNSKQIPEIKDWEVGKSYKIVLEVKEVASRIESNMDVEHMTADFKVKSYKIIEDDVDLEEMQAEGLKYK